MTGTTNREWPPQRGAILYAMRTVEEYLAKAAEFDELAGSINEPALKKRYADVAECYRLLADERRRLIGAGAIKSEP